MYHLIYSATFLQRYRKLSSDLQIKIRSTLKKIEQDPFTRRPGIHIRKLSGFHLRRWRVRVGDYRIIYHVEGEVIKVIEVFPRGRGYRFEFF